MKRCLVYLLLNKINSINYSKYNYLKINIYRFIDFMIFSFLFWIIKYSLINKNILKINDAKINRNFLSLEHCIYCIFNSYIYENYFIDLHFISLGYFLWDTIYILQNNIKQKKLQEVLYIYHHLVCLYALKEFKINNSLEINNLFKIGELSNIVNYLVYYLIKKNFDIKYINCVKFFQIINFTYYRIFIFTYKIFEYYYVINNRFLLYNLIAIYILGLIWGYNQIKFFVYSIKLIN